MNKITDITAGSKKAFENLEVLANLTSGNLRTLGSSDKVSKELKEIIKQNISKIGGDIIKFKIGGGLMTYQKKNIEKKMGYMRKLVNTPAWSVQELAKIKREESGEVKEFISAEIRDLRYSSDKEVRSIKESARERIEQIARNPNLSQQQKDLDIKNVQQQRDKSIQSMEKVAQSKISRLDKSKLATDEKLRKEIEEVNKLFK